MGSKGSVFGRAALTVSAAALAVMSVFSTDASAQGDTAYVPFVVNVNATVKAVPKTGTTAVVPSVEKAVTADQQTDLAIPLPKTGVLNGAQSRLGVPAVVSNHAGKVTVNLSAQSYKKAEISLYSVNGKRVLHGETAASEAARVISRGNLTAGAYLLSVKGADGDAVTSRLTHSGGGLDISVAFNAENTLKAKQLAKQAANGEWTITVKATASGYSDSAYTLIPVAGTNAKQTITLKSTSTDAPITIRSWTNVDYASAAPAANKHGRQRLDLKLPDSGDGPFPLILYVHGGGFTGGDWELSKNNNGLISSAPSKGYAVASAGYLLYQNNKASFPQMVEDILAAVRYLRANAETYHLDPNKFVIAGFSAGGYLTNIVCALSGATHTYDVTTLGNAGVSSNVQAAASSAGLTDFSKLVEQSGNTIHNTMAGGPLGGSLTDNTELMRNNLQKQNPLNYVSANTPPLYMRHGTGDNVVPYQQSEILFEKIKSVTPNAESLGKVNFKKITGGGHADFAGGNDSDTPDILNFLDNALGIQR